MARTSDGSDSVAGDLRPGVPRRVRARSGVLRRMARRPRSQPHLLRRERQPRPRDTGQAQSNQGGAASCRCRPMATPACIGKSLKQAAELALFERDNPSVQLIVKDDKGTPEGAKRRRRRGDQGRRQADPGPAVRQVRRPPSRRSRARPTSPSSPSPTTARWPRNGVYLLSFQPAPEVARVVAYAAQQGKRRFAALIPDDAFGKIVSASFTEAVSRVGRHRGGDADLSAAGVGQRSARAAAQRSAR